MATIKASFTRLVVFMLISLTESAAITQFFDVSFSTSASGNCYGYENQINSAIEDVVTLAQYLDQAVQFASEQFSEETEPDEEKTLVAQKLFGAYFGITFDGSKAISDDEDDWNDLQCENSRVPRDVCVTNLKPNSVYQNIHRFYTNGKLPDPKRPTSSLLWKPRLLV